MSSEAPILFCIFSLVTKPRNATLQKGPEARCRPEQERLTRQCLQKARAAELNAARARKAAQMQSIEDEIPDLSGPVSLGTYKFTRRGRGKKYETHKLSELQEMQGDEREGENKVTELTKTSFNHPNFTPPPPPTTTTFSSSQLSHHPTQHHKDVEVKDARINDSILVSFNDPSSDRRTFPELSRPQYGKTDQSHFATQFPGAINSIYTDKQSSQASRQVNPSIPPDQDCRSIQNSYALINPDTSSSQTTETSCPPENLNLNQHFSGTVYSHQQSLHPASGQADSPFTHQHRSSTQSLDAPIKIDRPALQTSTKANHSFSVSGYQGKPLQQYRQLARSLDDLIKTDRRESNGSGQSTFPFPPQEFQPPDTESLNSTNFLVTQEQGSPAVTQIYRPGSSRRYSSTTSLPLPDTLQTASFNLETNQWDPDSPKVIMAARTPASNSIRGGHSGGPSSRQSLSHMSQGSKEIGIPHAIVTTTKAGRPYTNPYSPIDPRISAARPTVRESPSGHAILEAQYHGSDKLQRQENLRYIGQEQAHHGFPEQDTYRHPEESLDDPFQDYPKIAHQTRRIQSSNYAEHAAQQAGYGEPSNHGHQQPASTYTSLSNASPYVPNARQVLQDPHSGISPNQGQRSVFEQQSIVDARTRKAGTAPLEQHFAYEQKPVINLRASVRLPAVRGTSTQQSVVLPERKFEGLFVEESTAKNIQEPGCRPAESANQANPGRLSHAIPIRDPAAYTGAGLTTRRNQEALRQNLDTVVASSQGITGSARTVMNDPHQARRPSSTATDTTITGSTLRAQAPSYESVPTYLSATTASASMMPTQMTTHLKRTLQGELQPVRGNAGNVFRGHERAATNSEPMYLRESYRAPAIPPGFHRDASAYPENPTRLPAEAIGAGNAFMNEIMREVPNKKTPQQRQEDAVNWFRHDSRDLSHAAAILSRESMNKINPERFPLEDTSRRTVGQLANDSQDDDPNDRARQVATPRPIGHGRPAGFVTPPSTHGRRQAGSQAPFSTLTGITSVNDTDGMRRLGRKSLDEDVQAIEGMMAGVFSNLMTAKNGPYDYTNHYAPPPAYAIDHNVRNDHTLFDPQWFATAPPARVGRDPRREQGEYEDPTQGSAGRRGDHVRGDFGRLDSGGRGCGAGRGWGRI